MWSKIKGSTALLKVPTFMICASIPNLSTSTLPIKGLVARYYFRDKQYAEALQLLNESENVNPYLHYNDFISSFLLYIINV